MAAIAILERPAAATGILERLVVSSSWCCYRCHRSIGFVNVVQVVATIIEIAVAMLVVFVAVLGLTIEVQGQQWRVLMMTCPWSVLVE